jgi:hypothetical protein
VRQVGALQRAASRRNAPAYPRAPELRARSSRVARIAPAARGKREKRARRLAMSKTRFLPGNVTPDVLVRDTTRARSPILDCERNRTHARTQQSSHSDRRKQRGRIARMANAIGCKSSSALLIAALSKTNLSISRRTPAKPVSRGVRDAYT